MSSSDWFRQSLHAEATAHAVCLSELQLRLADRFARAGIAPARLEARLLLQYALGLDETGLLREARCRLDKAQIATVEALVARRMEREPLAQILGSRDFWRDRFFVSRDVLTPRPDSETLIEAMLAHRHERDRAYRVLDAGTGSGCLLLSLLREYPRATGLGIDRSEAALHIARRNAHALGLDTRADFLCADWMQTLQNTYDMIISNPPYITVSQMAALEPEVRDYEPHMALSGGDDGLYCYRRILAEASHNLTREGLMVLELGDGQAEAVGLLAKQAGFQLVECRPDLAGIARAIVLERSH